MSISDNYVPLRQLGNGVTVAFSSNWNMIASAYARVYLESVATSVQTLVTQGPGPTQYTLVFNSSGFTVTFNTAPTSANYVVVGRDVAQDQTDPYRTSKGFQGDVLEASLDKVTAMVQDLSDISGRSLKFPLGSTALGVLPVPVDDAVLAWSGTSGLIKNGPTTATILSMVTAAAASAAAAAASAAAAAGAAAVYAPNAVVATPLFGMYSPAANTLGFASLTADALRLINPASAVNYWELSGAIASSAPTAYVKGSDTNIGMTFVTKGTSGFSFCTNGIASPQFFVGHAATAVNYFGVIGAAAGGFPLMQSLGSDTNIPFNFASKGTGNFNFYTNGGTAVQLQVAHAATAVNYMVITGAPAAGGPVMYVQGSDTNIAMNIYSKGSGAVNLYTNLGTPQFQVTHTASAVNYWSFTGSVTGTEIRVEALGTDTNIALGLRSKGTGAIFMYNGALLSVHIDTAVGGVNNARISGSATGNPVVFAANGSDADIDLEIRAKGAGVVKYGTYTAGILAQAGSVTIRDSGGTLRRLLVG